MKRKLMTEDSSTFLPSSSSANGEHWEGEDADRSEKRIKSEERRVQSLLEKRELERRRQCLVSDTLKKVDSAEGTGLNKKIRFDSDSDDDDTRAPTTATTSTTTNIAPLSNGSTRNGPNASSFASSSKKEGPALFDDDDDGELEDDGEAFALKPHFFGKKGAELMALESRYGGDDRFKLSDKFFEEEEEVSTQPLDPEQMERKQEKSNALGILERVLGHNLRGNDLEEETAPTNSTGRPLLVRFDPNNPEHERYDRAKPTKAEGSSEDEDEDETDEEPGDKLKSVAKEPKHVPSYHMDASFAESLRARLAQSANATDEQSTPQPFSLLSSLGRPSLPDSQPISAKAEISATAQALPKLEKWQTLQSHLADSSDSEGDYDRTADQRKITTGASKPAGTGCHFFLDADDPTVAKTVQRFRRTEDMEVVKKKWSKYRESIVKCYKRHKRLAVRTAKAKVREQYRSHHGPQSNSQQSSEKLEKDSKTFPQRTSAAKDPQLHEKNPAMKAKRLAKKKRRIATKKATIEVVP